MIVAEYAHYGCFEEGTLRVEILEFSHKVGGLPETVSTPTAFVKFEDGTLEEVQLDELRIVRE